MDFQGQKLAERLMLYIICIAGLAAFCMGWLEGSFALMMKVYGGGVAFAMVACVPDWPWYNSNELKWLPSAQPQEEEVARQNVAKQKKVR